MKAMARQRSHSIEFKRQVAQEFIAGESLYALSKRHDISRQLIRVWVQRRLPNGGDKLHARPFRLPVTRWRCQFWADCTSNISERKFPTGTGNSYQRRPAIIGA